MGYLHKGYETGVWRTCGKMNHQVPRVISYLQRQHIQIHRIQIIRFPRHVADHADADVFGGIVVTVLVYPIRGVEHFAVIAKPQNPAVWSVDDADVEALTLAFLEAVISDIVTDFFRKNRGPQGRRRKLRLCH